MFVIITYDVEAKRNAKVLKILRKYCYHEQNSVFDGELTETQLKKLKEELNKVCPNDKLTIYTSLTARAIHKDSSSSGNSNIYG